MGTRVGFSKVIAGVLTLYLLSGCAQSLQGDVGQSPEWGVGWMNLAAPTDFQKGERLRVHVGGTAEHILLRVLSTGQDSNTPVGLEGGVLVVPPNRIVEVVLENDHPNVFQVSVHGGANPWGQYPLGDHNGPATIENLEHIPLSFALGNARTEPAPAEP